MVDALCRAARWAKAPPACVIDLRPADVVASVELGLPDGTVVQGGGLAVDSQRRRRHAAADAALRSVLARGILKLVDEEEFAFFRYPASIDELRDYIATTWQDTRVDDPTYRRVVDLQRAHSGARLWLREHVAIRCLYSTA